MSSMEQSLPTLPLTKVTGGGGGGGMGEENVKVEREDWGWGNKLGYERKHFGHSLSKL